MKVAKRVAFGYVVFILLVSLLLVVEVFVFRRLQAVNVRNSGENLKLALVAVDLIRDGDVLEEYTTKYFLSADPGYKEEVKDFQQRFEDALREIRGNKGSERTQAEADRLDRFWREYLDAYSRIQPGSRDAGGLPPALGESLSKLRTQSITVYQAILEDIRSGALQSIKLSERMELIAWWIGCASLLVGILISFFIVRSISGPLRHLSEGTRAIAQGKSFYRLDTSRNDELSQIARDFNTILEREGRPGEGNAGPKKYEL